MILDEAVEAAAAAIDTCGCESPEWLARDALEAAAPIIMAQAWSEGWNAGASWPQDDTNPYGASK